MLLDLFFLLNQIEAAPPPGSCATLDDVAASSAVLETVKASTATAGEAAASRAIASDEPECD